MQTGIVNPLIADSGKHLYPAHFEQRAANPAGSLGQTFTDLGRFPLQQPDLAWRGLFFRVLEAAACGQGGVDAPFVLKAFERCFVVVGVGEEFGDVESDASGADDRNLATRDFASFDQLDVSDHFGVVAAGNVEAAWHDAGGE